MGPVDRESCHLTEARRARWTTPAVKRLDAGAAENGAGKTSDDPVNFS